MNFTAQQNKHGVHAKAKGKPADTNKENASGQNTGTSLVTEQKSSKKDASPENIEADNFEKQFIALEKNLVKNNR
jgi:hypothetical protein